MIHRKTAKGLSEIETRAHRLPPRLRSALILVDGKRSDEDLMKMILQEPAAALAALVEQGFIEVVAGSEHASPAAAASAGASGVAAAPSAPAVVPFEIRRRDAVRALTDLMGPLGEAAALRLEKARNPAELAMQVALAQQVISNTLGDAAAARYGERFGAG